MTAPCSERAAPARIAAVVLAAGRSLRTQPQHKLLAMVQGRPLIAWSVDGLLGSAVADIIVVTGESPHVIEVTLPDRRLRFVHNADFAQGMSTSIRAGLAALGAVDGALLCLADMPRVGPRHIEALIAAFESAGGQAICVPAYAGRRGNPVLWPARDFDRLRALTGDIGGRGLLHEHHERVRQVAMPDDAVLRDIDTSCALAEFAAEISLQRVHEGSKIRRER